ncbi:MAG: hypothetical protein SNJ82_03965, partial [Gemmataceae bacterium]
MSLTHGVLLVLGLTALGCVVGGVLGYPLDTTFPSYYRGVFPNGTSPEFDPVAVGLGLGLSQGAMFGAVL